MVIERPSLWSMCSPHRRNTVRTIELVDDLASLEYIDEVPLPAHGLLEDRFTPV